jgi:lipid II:glycine glycyltransferase (peptidoglycan interpeptide bridge formation enzyme)
MNFEKTFPEILEKTYKNCKNLSTKSMPFVKVKSKIIGERIILLPFLDVFPIRELSYSEIYNFLKQEKNNKEKIEIRLSEFNENLDLISKTLKKNGFKRNIVKGHIVSNLTNQEDFWNRFHKHTRNDIRKSEKSDLIIKKIDSIKELKKFYSLYLREMKRFGTPQHSFNYFKNCLDLMKENFFGLNCYFNNKVVGSIIIFLDKENGYIAFNVSSKKARNLRPNDLLYWEAIKECMQRGVKNLDFGQIDLSSISGSREENLLRFKKNGSEESTKEYTLLVILIMIAIKKNL